MSLNNLSDEQILSELTQRVKQKRLNLNITQEELSKRAGVHVQTIKNFESGKTTTLLTFIQIVRAFGELDALDSFFPDPGISPIALLKLKGKERTRASGSSRSKKQDPLW
ncbi:helix-turn-helix transcriptional regulator [Aquimarina sp. 2201CG5-10]|uniref:helix-turn-helix transcriptional regulator n=1 Tax=Aquimarina callyspongiae TaxID=3098150 RepID=UPI002AB36F1D|nr:helix-turn-helix transcriptional regulator [Aquimarina sp. 2201CG5-10]MDY8136170.1 helix-turn-helix transcriptional regulator [Aquimarina sp. 2201CG5-10]